MQDSYKSVFEMLGETRPIDPIYCVYPHVYHETAREFLDGFPGRVLYAIKANNDPKVLQALFDGGITHVDCASLQEIREAHAVDKNATCYFMNPVRLRGAARTAQQEFGVRHFVIDHATGLELLLKEIDAVDAVIHGPAGLDIGAEMPESIALAIVAEIHASLNRRDGVMLSLLDK